MFGHRYCPTHRPSPSSLTRGLCIFVPRMGWKAGGFKGRAWQRQCLIWDRFLPLPQRIETTSHPQSYPRRQNLPHNPAYSSCVRAACSDQWREGQPGVGQSRAHTVCGSAVDSLVSWAAHCDVVPRIGLPSYLLTRKPGIPRRFSSQFLVSGTKAVSGLRSAFTTARQRSPAVRSHARKNALDLNPEINIKISLYLRVR
jgi:hypothetical protein